MENIITVDQQAITTYLKEAGRRFGIDDDDDVTLGFSNDNNGFTCWINLQGNGHFLHMFAQQQGKYSRLSMEECLEACNDWNCSRLFPVLTVQEGRDGRLFFRTEWAVDLAKGVNVKLFGDMMETFFPTSGMCFDWLRDEGKV